MCCASGLSLLTRQGRMPVHHMGGYVDKVNGAFWWKLVFVGARIDYIENPDQWTESKT